MREFVVTLRNGKRFTVRADRVKRESDYLALVVAPPPTIGDLDPFEGVVALFDRHPPLTNPGRSSYALALATLGRAEAGEQARAAWRRGLLIVSSPY